MLPKDCKVQKIYRLADFAILSREVRGFLGVCGVVRIWVKDFCETHESPLFLLTKKDMEFVWATDQKANLWRI